MFFGKNIVQIKSFYAILFSKEVMQKKRGVVVLCEILGVIVVIDQTPQDSYNYSTIYLVGVTTIQNGRR